MTISCRSQARARRAATHATLFLAVLLCGCTGLYIPYDNEDETDDVQPEVKPITANLVVQLAQQAAHQPAAAVIPVSAQGPYAYRLGVGDVLDIRIPSIATFGTPQAAAPVVTTEREAGYVVAPDGSIVVPFAGSIQVAGMTVREVQNRVAELLSRYIKGPTVNVAVQQFRSQKVLVGGQVAKPGFLPVTDVPLTLLGALTLSGSTPVLRSDQVPRPMAQAVTLTAQPESPDYTRVELIRGGSRYTVDILRLLRKGDLAQDVTLRDGDAVYVPPVDRDYVFVLGEVKQPAMLEVSRGNASLAEVLATAGGVNQTTAKAERVYVIRGELNKPEVYQLNANAPDALLLADAFRLKSRDVVYVAEANISRWNRLLTQLVPTIQTLLTGGIFGAQVK